MTTLKSAFAGAPRLALTPPQRARIDRALLDYVEHYRLRVITVAREDQRLADLALSFSALLFVIAVRHRGVDSDALKTAVIRGVSLKPLAGMAGLPMWTRKLRPAAFDAVLGRLPHEPLIAKLICNHLPKTHGEAGLWLRAVGVASRWGGDGFAVWVARLTHRERLKLTEKTVQRLAVWAWHSGQSQSVGARFLGKPWTMQISLDAAVKEANDWRERMELHVMLGEDLSKPRLRDGRWEGRDFVHLANAAMLDDEANRMKNCIKSHAFSVYRDGEEFWSVRRDGVSLATVQIGLHYDDALPHLVEIKGPQNARVGPDVALAVRRWLMSHDIQSISWPLHKPQHDPALRRWRAFLKPYWLAMGACPSWLPLTPKDFDLGYVSLKSKRRRLRRQVNW